MPQRQSQSANFKEKQRIIQQLNQMCQRNVNSNQENNKKIEQTDMKFVNVPQPTNEVQKVLIKKSDLQTFTKHFANQKIKFDQELQIIQNKLSQTQSTLDHFRKQNVQLKRQKNQYKQRFLKEQEKAKLCQKRLKQLQNFEIIELKRVISQLQSKLAYEKQQLTRYQQFLKIKEEIIKNMEWEKSISNQRSKTHRQFNYKTENAEQFYTQMQYNKFTQQKPATNRHSYQKHSQTLKLQDLSQIAQNTDQNPYFVKNIDTSKSKKNIRLNASSEKLWQKEPQHQKVKKVITIRKTRMNTQSQKQHLKKGNEELEEQLKNYQNQIENLQQMIFNLKSETQIIKHENEVLLKNKEIIKNQLIASQNNTPKIQNLQKQLAQKNIIIEKLQSQLSIKNISSSMGQKYKFQSNKGVQNFGNSKRALEASNNKYSADKDRSILILNQKCLLLQRQIQKFMRKILVLQQKNKQLDISLKKNSTKKKTNSEQLITPQFKDIKFKKFFPKVNERQQSSQKQKDQDYKSHITDTFSKKQFNSQLSNIKKSSPVLNQSSQQKKSIIRNFNINQIEDDEESIALESDMILFK